MILKNIQKYVLLFNLLLLSSLLVEGEIQAQMNPKVRSIVTMAAYGATGGALLGVATMAFDSEPRSIAIGASLGLYGGLLFGGYIVLSHMLKKNGYFKRRQNYYDSDYDQTAAPNGVLNSTQFRRWDPYLASQLQKNQVKAGLVKHSFGIRGRGKQIHLSTPLVYNIFSAQF